MAYPAYRSKSSTVTSNDTGTTSFNVASAEPSGAAQNDILICVFVVHPYSLTYTGMTGWTKLYERANSADDSYTAVWWIRRGTSAPNLTVSWTGTAYYREAVVIAYSGCKETGNPYNAYASDAGTSDATPNPDPPSVTTTVGETLNVVLGMGWQGATSTWATPSGYTTREAGAAGTSWSIHEKQLASATTENCAEITGTAAGTSGWDAVAIALEPEGASQSNAPRAAHLMKLMGAM